MRTCRTCQTDKPLNSFRKNKDKAQGRDTICKQCYSAKAKKYQKRYRESPQGRAVQTWHKILQRVGNKDGKNPSYSDVELRMTKQEFLEWAIPQYKNWNESTTPSINRIDPYGHYEIDNLEIISLESNILKPKRTMTSHTKAKKTQQVVQYVIDNCSTYDLDLSEVIHLLSNKKGTQANNLST